MWRQIYFLPVLLVPIVCTTSQVVLVINFNAAEPSDSIHAEVTGHLWFVHFSFWRPNITQFICYHGRLALLGYAGVTTVESLPSSILAFVAVRRMIALRKLQYEHRTGLQYRCATTHIAMTLRGVVTHTMSTPEQLTRSSEILASPVSPAPSSLFSHDKAPVSMGTSSGMPSSPPRFRHLFGDSSALGNGDQVVSQPTSCGGSMDITPEESDIEHFPADSGPYAQIHVPQRLSDAIDISPEPRNS